jgi:hypothetical protein
MSVFALIGGTLGVRLSGVLGFFICCSVLVWFWARGGLKRLILFGPFFNLPLKNEKRVKVIATCLFLWLAIGNANIAINPEATNKALNELDAAISGAH